MSDPTPLRGMATVAQLETLLRPQGSAQDGKFSATSQPTIQQVCDEIDRTWDQIIYPGLVTWGIIVPVVEPTVARIVASLNATIAACWVDRERHGKTEFRETPLSQRLLTSFNEEWKTFLEDTELPASATNSSRPIIPKEKILFSNIADLYTPYDENEREAFFRMDKEY